MRLWQSALLLGWVAACHAAAVYWSSPQAVGVVLPGSGRSDTAWDINSSGAVVGNSIINGGSVLPVLWENGSMTVLPTPNGHGEARSINDQGDVLGSIRLADGTFQGYLWSATLGNQPVPSGYAINDSEQIVTDDYSSGVSHGVIWSPSTGSVDLGTFGGFSSEAFDINNSGEIVGGYRRHSIHP